ncbi:MAG TPA: hypothetical protein DEP69_01235 [Acidimicrobiaceae bacterium]|nr:hypothetical protein [Acidimicrobiaceae bacterium]
MRPRRAWPGVRALAGGLLVTLALGGLWWSYTQANAKPSARFVVAVTDIAPGTVVTSDHVGLQAVDLPSGMAAAAFGPGRDLEVLGSVAVNVVSAGELVMASDVRPVEFAAGVQSRYELSFEIERARVLNGRLPAGEFVDLVATIGSGSTGVTETIAADAQVLAVEELGEGGFGLGTVAVTVAVRSERDVLGVVAAVDQGVLTLVRAPRVRPAPEPSPGESDAAAPDEAAAQERAGQ